MADLREVFNELDHFVRGILEVGVGGKRDEVKNQLFNSSQVVLQRAAVVVVDVLYPLELVVVNFFGAVFQFELGDLHHLVLHGDVHPQDDPLVFLQLRPHPLSHRPHDLAVPVPADEALEHHLYYSHREI